MTEASRRDVLARQVAIRRALAKKRARRKFFTYYPDEGPLRRELYPQHMAFFRMGQQVPTRCFMAANRVGKALQHGTKVATPNGWVVIESLRPGDQVMAGDGTPTTVVGVYPQGEVDLFAVSFDGVHDIVTCGEHLWKYLPPKARFPQRHSHGKWQDNPSFGRWTVGNTAELASFKMSSPRQRPVVPATQAFEFPALALPMDPYVLGVLLGDGGLSRDSAKLSSNDQQIVDAVAQHFKVTHYKGCDYGVHGAIGIVRALGLQGTTSATKFIPQQYLLAHQQARLAVLQGLMDTDGSISVTGAMEYSTCSDALADGFEWLAASLGMKTRRVRRHTKAQNGNGLPSWRILLRSATVCPFLLQRKADRWSPLRETGDWLVHAVNPAGRGLATCIEVAHQSHTFVIEHGIVTHNTEGAGGYEMVCHLTGQYPAWWEGRRFATQVDAWCAGDTKETVRDILQLKLLGPEGQIGTGLIPGEDILQVQKRPNGNGAVDFVTVRHKPTGGISRLGFKSYDQGREAFQGTEKQIVWLDEESNEGVRAECVMRLMTTDGLLIETFTPLRGLTPIVLGYLGDEGAVPDGRVSVGQDRGIIFAGWDDVPHLGAEQKRRMLAEAEPHLRAARSKGVPSLGAGAIYPVDEDEILVDDFALPAHWPRAYGLDVGWNRTAAVFGAIDRDTDVLYLWSEHYQGQQEPSTHVAAINARGRMNGVIDPASRGRSQKDGEQLLEDYLQLGLQILPANNSRESGLFNVHQRLATGRLKVFKSLRNWLKEYRIYRRDEKGHVVKEHDHLMDATRYLVVSGLDVATTSVTADAQAYKSKRKNSRRRAA